ncbi:MAG: sulfur transferase domain-containing protein [Acidobacteria bacterium]|nr:sulfur transferase domain-containing protein [Acidobacteriota bacterium]
MRIVSVFFLVVMMSWGQDVVFSGQPSAEQLAAYKKDGVKVVVNLRTDDEMSKLGLDEKGIVEKAGMQYLSVPFLATAPPKDEELAGLMKLLAGAKPEGRVVLHCASSNRVGYVWGLFQAKEKGVGVEKAVEEARKAGMKSPALEQALRDRLK